MKKVYLVGFDVRTRVIVDESEIEGDLDTFLIEKARSQIMSEAYDYLNGDNLTECDEDEECPYDEEFDNR